MKLFSDTELVVDNFAGGGGASKGIEQALSRSVDLAINHNETAIAMHTVNHPDTNHFCESVWNVDPKEACDGSPVGLAWFSPDCTHFSKARGSKPVDKDIRALAWVVVRWAAKVKPRMIMLENVEEFLTWGPVIKGPDGKFYPDPEKKGETFSAFVKALQRLGYDVDWQELRACDFGSPTIRKRLFMVARCDEEPINWPEPTHGNPSSEDVKNGLIKPWRTAAECIEWTILCPSIFMSKKDIHQKYGLNVRRPLAEATQKRIAKGVKKYVIDDANPFIIPIAHYNGTDIVHDINDPLRTITARPKGGSFALAAPTLIQTGYGERKGQSPRVPGLHKPLGTVVAGGTKHALVSAHLMVNTTHNTGTKIKEPVKTLTSGTHQYLISSFLAKHYTGAVGSDLKDPLGTITSIDHHALVAAHIIRHFGESVGSSPGVPVGTITPGGMGKTGVVISNLTNYLNTPIGNHSADVWAFLLKYYGTDQNPQLKEPMHTITTKDRFALVTVNGINYQLTDIGMRMLAPRELFRAQGFPDSYIIDRDINGKSFTKSAQVALCGNSVCPDLARSLVGANLPNGGNV